MRRRRLGQHYLTDGRVVASIVALADVRPSEKVLEIGTGRGILTRELAKAGSAFLGFEIDPDNLKASKDAVRGTGARIVLADAFEQDPEFDVLVASLPYSESASFVRWLCARRFGRAVVVLQKDFLEKITASPGDRDYRGISALSQIAFEMKVLAKVGREAFEPRPRVESVVVSFRPRRMVSADETANVIRLFSLRRRQIEAALAELGFRGEGGHGKRRVSSLTPAEVHEICGPPVRP